MRNHRSFDRLDKKRKFDLYNNVNLLNEIENKLVILFNEKLFLMRDGYKYF